MRRKTLNRHIHGEINRANVAKREKQSDYTVAGSIAHREKKSEENELQCDLVERCRSI